MHTGWDFHRYWIYGLILVTLLVMCTGCGFYMLSKMAGFCARNGGVAESEVADGGYMRVVCVDGTVRKGRVK